MRTLLSQLALIVVAAVLATAPQQSMLQSISNDVHHSAGGGSVTYVQDAFGGGAGACFHTPTCTTTSFTPAVGDYLVVFTVTSASSNTITSEIVTDTCNSGGTTNTYTNLKASAFTGNNSYVLTYAKVGAASSCAVTTTLIGPTNEQTLVYVQQIHGAAASSPVEGSGTCGSTLLCAVAAQVAPGTGSNAITSGSGGTPTVSGSYVFAATVDVAQNNPFVVGTGFTLRRGGSNAPTCNDSLVSLSCGAEGMAWTSGAVAGTFTSSAGGAGDYETAVAVFHP